MSKKSIDWKDVADSYYEKSVSLAILILLFAFLVSPKIEVKPFKHVIKESQMIELPPEIKEKIKPPEETVKPVVEVVIDDDLESDDEEDIEIVDTIVKTTLEPLEQLEQTDMYGKIPDFVVYEDPPVPIKQPPPEYSDFARKSGIEGQVWLDVEIFVNGKVGKIRVIKSLMAGPGGLDEAAVAAVKNWEYEPAKSGGKPVDVRVKFPVNFYLQ